MLELVLESSEEFCIISWGIVCLDLCQNQFDLGLISESAFWSMFNEAAKQHEARSAEFVG